MSKKRLPKSGSPSKRTPVQRPKIKIERYALFSYIPVALGLHAHADHSVSASHDDEGEREDFSVPETSTPGQAAQPPAALDIVDYSPILTGKEVNTSLKGAAGPKRPHIWAGTIQPVTTAGPDGGSMHIRGLALIAPPRRRAILGGMPSTGPAGCVVAPILIEDSDVDAKIELRDNVRIGRKVRMVKVTHLQR
jgi:hypothetical protein